MATWRGKRRLVVVSVCHDANGAPNFALSEISVNAKEYADGVHYDRAKERLLARGYEGPFVYFDEYDSPPFLIPAVKKYLGLKKPTSAQSKGVIMPRLIEVVVSPKGETTVQTKGFVGADCLLASKFLEGALGIITADKKTTEFYETVSLEQHQNQA